MCLDASLVLPSLRPGVVPGDDSTASRRCFVLRLRRCRIPCIRGTVCGGPSCDWSSDVCSSDLWGVVFYIKEGRSVRMTESAPLLY